MKRAPKVPYSTRGARRREVAVPHYAAFRREHRQLRAVKRRTVQSRAMSTDGASEWGGIIESADPQLVAIAEIGHVAATAGIDLWLRGGWAVDFFLGETTRDHEDVDFFIWVQTADDLVSALHNIGYVEVPRTSRLQQRDVTKDGVECSFALIDSNDRGETVVAGGPWAGERWPRAMLSGPTCRLHGVTCRVIHPEAQIEIKQMTPIWIPGRPRRTKDRLDIARLDAALRPAR